MKKINYLISLLPIFSLTGCNENKVTVTLNFNNGDPNQTITITAGSCLSVDNPTKERCNFLWWNKDDTKFDLATPINEDITLDAHYSFNNQTLFLNKPNAEKRNDNANVRIMSYNLLASVYNNHPHHHGYNPVNDPYPNGVDDGRDYQAMDTIMRYLPDVVGLQECDQTTDEGNVDQGWYDFFKQQYDLGKSPYKIVNDEKRTGNDGDGEEHTIFSTIMYNSNTVEPVEGSFQTIYSEYSDNANCRWLSCCTFHLKNTEKYFIVTSTHWNMPASKEYNRIEQAIESATLTLEYASSHNNYPVITTGDYNQNETSKEYGLFLKTSGYSDTKYTATKRGLVIPTYHLGDGTGSSKDCEESSANHYWYRDESTLLNKPNYADKINGIDHLFMSPGVKCTYYDVITESRALYSSDHFPSYVDVII